MKPEAGQAELAPGQFLTWLFSLPDEHYAVRREQLGLPRNKQEELDATRLYYRNEHPYEAKRRYEDLVADGPRPHWIYSGFATILMRVGEVERAAEYYRRALQANPTMPTYWDNLIYCLDHTDISAAEAYEIRRQWWERYGSVIQRAASEWPPHANTCDPERPLRVGYVSGDFRSHSATFLFYQVLMRHSPAVQAYGYFTAPAQESDDWTEIYSQEMIVRNVNHLDTNQFAALIRKDQIDVLVDLASYTNHSRLDVFCLQAAPVQVTSWGYVLGTGLPTIQAIFGDAIALPCDQQSHFSERIVHLPCIIPFVGPLYAPNVEARTPDTPFVFAAFSRPAKIKAEVLRVWGDLLRSLPESRLLFKTSLADHAEYRQHVLNGLRVDPARVSFEGYSPHAAHLGAYGRADLGLDPWPHGGGATVAEGLWQGVPHVARLGERICGRLAASVYDAIGLDGFVAKDQDDYLGIARFFAEHRALLTDLRPRLRGMILGSRMAQGYVDAVESAYRDLWRVWCKGNAS